MQSAPWWAVWPICRTQSPRRLSAQRSCRGEQHGGCANALTIKKSECWVDLMIPARTSRHPVSIIGSGRKTKIWECWLSLLFTQKREMQVQAHHQELITSDNNFCVKFITSSSSTGKLVAMYSHKRKSSRDPKKLTGVVFLERESIFTEHREVVDFLDLRADQAAQGEQAALSKLSEAEYEEQRNQTNV